MSTLPAITAGRRGRSIALVAVSALGQAAAAGVAAFATRDVFAAFGAGDAGLPITALVLVALAGLVIATLRVAERVVAERVGQDYAGALRLKLFLHLGRMPARAVAGRRSGALAMRFVGDLAAVRNWVSLGVARLVSASIVLPVACAVLFALNPALGVAATVPVVLGIALMTLAGLSLGPAHRRLRARRARLAADMSERIPHAPELRLLGRTRTEKAHLARRTRALIASAAVRARAAATVQSIPDAVAGIAAALVFLVALRQGAASAEAAGALAALGLMVQPMRDLAGVWDRHRAWAAAREKCEDILAHPTVDRRRTAKPRPVPAGPQPLRFAGVAAGSVDGFDGEVPAGAKIAILGPNGAGKSTLLALAAGLERPRDGTVSLGDRRTIRLSERERRDAIALVGPRSPILAGSLRRALTMGVGGQIDDDRILAAAADFGLTDTIARLGGLDGRVAEAGRNLSSGEARRVLLTRAALSAAPLLLLDEPDDSLDADGVRLVERLIRAGDATALLVTHDPDLACRMDWLWFVADGRLVEAGPPDALLAGTGPTARFFGSRAAA